MPVLLAGLALTAAGTGMQIAGNKQAQSAIGAARAKELALQQEHQKEASAVFQNSVQQAGADTSANTLAKGVAARSAMAQAISNSTVGANTDLPIGTQTGYQVTDGNTAASRANASTGAWSNVVGGAANKLGSYGDLGTQQGIDNSNATAKLGVVSNKARGDANLLPLELEVASHQGDSLSGWGKIVGALGAVTSMGAASGIGAAAPAVTGATTAAQTGSSLAASVAPWAMMAAGRAPQWQF